MFYLTGMLVLLSGLAFVKAFSNNLSCRCSYNRNPNSQSVSEANLLPDANATEQLLHLARERS
jgi:hypothetical protein